MILRILDFSPRDLELYQLQKHMVVPLKQEQGQRGTYSEDGCSSSSFPVRQNSKGHCIYDIFIDVTV